MKNTYLLQFLHRGLLFGGFGPIVAAIVYLILGFTVPDFSVTGDEMFLAIVSTYLLAFVHAGASIFHQIDHWSPARSMLFHFGTLYLSYVLCYVINAWIPFRPIVLLIFTLIFVLTYFVIWFIVFLVIKGTEKRLNAKLK